MSSLEAAIVPPTEGERVLSVDVECIATGPGHNDRAVSWIAVVDAQGTTLLSQPVRPPGNIFNYLTVITGQRNGDLDDAPSLEEVLPRVRKLLGPDVVLVGQGIDGDIKWLALCEGTDFKRKVDLGAVFAAYNPRYKNTSFFSLRHEASTLLGEGRTGAEEHCPADDARSSVLLYNRYVIDAPHELAAAKLRLLAVRPTPSVAKMYNYNYEGVCMAKFFRAKCTCGQDS